MWTVHEISAHKSEQDEIEAWEETALRPQSRDDYPELDEEIGAFDDQLKPQWLMGVKKKEDWEERPLGVKFT